MEPAQFADNIKQVRTVVIPKLLESFRSHGIHATWAAVGGIMASNTGEFLNYSHLDQKPSYKNQKLSSYEKAVCEDLSEMFLYPESINLISSVQGQEIGSHTYTHYYCTEEGQTAEQFKADMESALSLSSDKGMKISSVVFPRNQINEEYLRICSKLGFKAYRGIEENWIYNWINFVPLRRLLRFVDRYINISGANIHDISFKGGMINITGSRFFSPYMSKLAFMEGLKVRRIKKQMLAAAKHGKVFHLWWHPHNFSTYTENNMENLESILNYYEELKAEYGFQSLNMGEIAENKGDNR